MDRRDALGLFGLLGAGVAVESSRLLAEDHGHAKKDGDRFSQHGATNCP